MNNKKTSYFAALTIFFMH